MSESDDGIVGWEGMRARLIDRSRCVFHVSLRRICGRLTLVQVECSAAIVIRSSHIRSRAAEGVRFNFHFCFSTNKCHYEPTWEQSMFMTRDRSRQEIVRKVAISKDCEHEATWESSLSQALWARCHMVGQGCHKAFRGNCLFFNNGNPVTS